MTTWRKIREITGPVNANAHGLPLEFLGIDDEDLATLDAMLLG